MSAPSRALKTLVVHHRSGIGDLVWHVPYFRAIAVASAGGVVTVVARPSCRAADLLAPEATVDKVIEYDFKPRGSPRRRGAHEGLSGQLAFVRLLRAERFDRVYIFAGRVRYAVLTALAGIAERAGFGFSPAERLLLNRPPFIERYRGAGSWVYPEATAFAHAHGFVSGPVVPRLKVPDGLVTEIALQTQVLPALRVALVVGASETRKQWGSARFSLLAAALADLEMGVILLGGPAEAAMVAQIRGALTIAQQRYVLPLVQTSVLRSAAAIRRCALCVGNDTGMLNVAAASGVSAIGLFGATRPLKHDPLLQGITADGMASIAVEQVLTCVNEHMAHHRNYLS